MNTDRPISCTHNPQAIRDVNWKKQQQQHTIITIVVWFIQSHILIIRCVHIHSLTLILSSVLWYLNNLQYLVEFIHCFVSLKNYTCVASILYTGVNRNCIFWFLLLSSERNTVLDFCLFDLESENNQTEWYHIFWRPT